jgi:hypothetical protein
MTGTFFQYVSINCNFIDTYFGHVDDVDTNERTYMAAKLDAAIAASLEEVGYGG